MLNYVYQLSSPKIISVKYKDIDIRDKVIVRPNYLALCHADQRYYQGKRDAKILRKKLPMALIHECCGVVVYDATKTFKKGQKVVMVPNVPGKECEGIYENYAEGSQFLSSGTDGFMRELIDLPSDRVIAYDDIDDRIAAITEFISVGMHAFSRFEKIAHDYRDKIGIWGDGSLAYIVACILKYSCPNSKIIVVGKNVNKLNQFSFVDETHLVDSLDENFSIDHAFECAGGEGSFFAIDDIIKYIKPQGTVMLMGVSENKVAINTRDILEKGLTFVGSSRSGREDFQRAVKFMENKSVQRRLKTIVFEDEPVKDLVDIHRVFANDLNTEFKTVFKWDI